MEGTVSSNASVILREDAQSAYSSSTRTSTESTRETKSANRLSLKLEIPENGIPTPGVAKVTQSVSELRDLLKELQNERERLVGQLEAEDRDRYSYYRQLEGVALQIRDLPVPTDSPSLEYEIERRRLEQEEQRHRDMMNRALGPAKETSRRREERLLALRSIDQKIAVVDNLIGQSEAQVQAVLDKVGDKDDEEGKETLDVPPSFFVNPEMWQSGSSNIFFAEDRNNGQGDTASVMSFTSSIHSMGSSGGANGGGLLPHKSHGLAPKVEVMYSLLSMLASHDKENMSKTLLSMSSNLESCVALRQAGCLPLLVQLIHGHDAPRGFFSPADKATRSRACETLRRLVQGPGLGPGEDRRARRESRILRFLEIVREYSDYLRDLKEKQEKEGVAEPLNDDMERHPGPTVAGLMKLSFDEEHRHAMCQLGGLQTLAELLQVDHGVHGLDQKEVNCLTLRRYASMALTNLTFGDGSNKSLLCSQKGLLKVLNAQLASSSDELRQASASVLRNLSWRADSVSKEALKEAGTVKALMEVSMTTYKESTLKSILSALWNLSAHSSDNKIEICNTNDALSFLVETLSYKSESKTLAVVESAGGVLRNISSHVAAREDYRAILRQHNCLPVLLQQLRSPSLTVVSNACGTLWNLSARCSEDQQFLWNNGAVPLLRSLIHSRHRMIALGSSAALKNLLAAKPGGPMSVSQLSSACSSPLHGPTLQARKQRQMEQELDPNLAETCENIESSSPPKSPAHRVNDINPFDRTLLHARMYRSLGSNYRSLSPRFRVPLEHKESLNSVRSESRLNQAKLLTNLRNPLRSSSLERYPAEQKDTCSTRFAWTSQDGAEDESPAQKPAPANFNLPKRPYSTQSYHFDDEDNDQPIDFSLKYSEDVPTNSNTDYKPLEAQVRVYSSYTETDLDEPEQPTDFSLRYAEKEEEGGRHQADMNNDADDSMQTYYTEGTPYETPSHISLATSMTDLREPQPRPPKTIDEDQKEDEDDEDEITTPDPSGARSRASTVSSSSSASRSAEEEHRKEGKPSQHDRTPPTKSTRTDSTKTVTFSAEDNYAEQTPLMFSRCSSLGSLGSIDQQPLPDDGSIVSEFSRLTSRVVSPSELPDSPCQTMPPSPKRLHAPVTFTATPPAATAVAKPHTTTPSFPVKPVLVDQKYLSRFDDQFNDDDVQIYGQEGTPAYSKIPSPLSTLSIENDMEEEVKNTNSETLQLEAVAKFLPVTPEQPGRDSRLPSGEITRMSYRKFETTSAPAAKAKPLLEDYEADFDIEDQLLITTARKVEFRDAQPSAAGTVTSFASNVPATGTLATSQSSFAFTRQPNSDVFKDAFRSFNEEGTPGLTRATSLSSLHIDDGSVASPPKSPPPKLKTTPSVPPPVNISVAAVAKCVFEDNVRMFTEEGTPSYTRASSLSSLTLNMDEEGSPEKSELVGATAKSEPVGIVEPGKGAEEAVEENGTVKSPEQSPATEHQQSEGAALHGQPHSTVEPPGWSDDDSEADDDHILSACISSVLPKNKNGSTMRSSLSAGNLKVIKPTGIPLPKFNTSPTSYTSSHRHQPGGGLPKSISLNSALGSKYAGDSSDSSAEDDQFVLAQCIQSAMPKSRKMLSNASPYSNHTARNTATNGSMGAVGRPATRNGLGVFPRATTQPQLVTSRMPVMKSPEDASKAIKPGKGPMSQRGRSKFHSSNHSEPRTPVSLESRFNFKVEDTPVSFSRNSSLSSLSMDSNEDTEAEKALLEDCIHSGMPNSRKYTAKSNSKASKSNKASPDKPSSLTPLEQRKSGDGKAKSDQSTPQAKSAPATPEFLIVQSESHTEILTESHTGEPESMSSVMSESTLIAIEATQVVHNISRELNRETSCEPLEIEQFASLSLSTIGDDDHLFDLSRKSPTLEYAVRYRQSPSLPRKFDCRHTSAKPKGVHLLRQALDKEKTSISMLASTESMLTSSCHSNIDNVKPPAEMFESALTNNSSLQTSFVMNESFYDSEHREALLEQLAQMEAAVLVSPDQNANLPITDETDSARSSQERRLTPKERRQRDKERYQTYTLPGTGTESGGDTDLEGRDGSEPEPASGKDGDDSTEPDMDETLRGDFTTTTSCTLTENMRKTVKQRRNENRERYQTRTISGSDTNLSERVQSTDSAASTKASTLSPDKDLELNLDELEKLEQDVKLVISNLKESRGNLHSESSELMSEECLLECETLSLVSSGSEFDMLSISSKTRKMSFLAQELEHIPVFQEETGDSEQEREEEAMAKARIIKPSEKAKEEEIKVIRGRKKVFSAMRSVPPKPVMPPAPSRVIEHHSGRPVASMTPSPRSPVLNRVARRGRSASPASGLRCDSPLANVRPNRTSALRQTSTQKLANTPKALSTSSVAESAVGPLRIKPGTSRLGVKGNSAPCSPRQAAQMDSSNQRTAESDIRRTASTTPPKLPAKTRVETRTTPAVAKVEEPRPTLASMGKQGTFTKDKPETESARSNLSEATDAKPKIPPKIPPKPRAGPANGKAGEVVRAADIAKGKPAIPKKPNVVGLMRARFSNPEPERPKLQPTPSARRSSSSASLNSDTSEPKRAPPKKIVTSKIASLWKQVEESRSKQKTVEGQDQRKWLGRVEASKPIEEDKFGSPLVTPTLESPGRLVSSSTFEKISSLSGDCASPSSPHDSGMCEGMATNGGVRSSPTTRLSMKLPRFAWSGRLKEKASHSTSAASGMDSPTEGSRTAANNAVIVTHL